MSKIQIAEPVEKTPRQSFTPKQRLETLMAGRGRCKLCAVKLGDEWEADHIIPLGQGGKHEPGNWQALCKPCHHDKTHGTTTARGDNDETRRAKRRQLKHTGQWPEAKGNRKLSGRGFEKRWTP
jgi:5-methylcytosine-specific restriction endonuclease McrA